MCSALCDLRAMVSRLPLGDTESDPNARSASGQFHGFTNRMTGGGKKGYSELRVSTRNEKFREERATTEVTI